MAASWEFIIPGVGMDIPNLGALPFTGVVNQVVREHLTTLQSMDEMKALVRERIFSQVREMAAGLHDLYIIPSPYISLFFDGCLEKAKDISLGSKYNNFGFHGTGLATAADGMAAVEEMVFKRHTDPAELLHAMDADFKGFDALRYQLKQECPKMGNDEDAADQYACFLLDTFADSLEGLRHERGGVFRAGTGSAMYYLWHGRQLGATADGRQAGEMLPANFSPSLLLRDAGPLSVLQAMARPTMGLVCNGGPMTLELHDTVFKNEEGCRKVAQLVGRCIILS